MTVVLPPSRLSVLSRRVAAPWLTLAFFAGVLVGAWIVHLASASPTDAEMAGADHKARSDKVDSRRATIAVPTAATADLNPWDVPTPWPPLSRRKRLEVDPDKTADAANRIGDKMIAVFLARQNLLRHISHDSDMPLSEKEIMWDVCDWLELQNEKLAKRFDEWTRKLIPAE